MAAIGCFPVAFVIFFVSLASGAEFSKAAVFSAILSISAASLFAIGAAKRTARNQKIHEEKLQNLKVQGAVIVREHLPALVRRYRQLVRLDDYGHSDPKEWEKEREHFWLHVARRKLPIHLRDDESKRSFFSSALDPIVVGATAAQRLKFTSQFDSDIAPTDYEHFCAERLRALGWDANVTKAAGDQGADIVAKKAGRVMVVQCKRYAKPVGNKAVQEIVGALEFYNAGLALVIATNGYTKAAIALAAVNRVTLIHHDDLTEEWAPS